MFKKYKVVAAICAAGLVGGIATQTVDASASVGAENQGESQEVHTQAQNNQQDNASNADEFQNFFQECLAKWNISWEQDKTEEQEKPVVNEPSEQPEQPEQTEKPEQPEQAEKPVVNQPAPQPEQGAEKAPEENAEQDNQMNELNEFEQQVVELTNQERVKHGLSALKVDVALSKVARDKSKDMQVNGYFDHNSPTYGSPFDMMQAYGIDYQAAGENIARGQRTPAEVVDGWMNSEGHRANILNSSFTHIGVGYVENGNYWTQQFIGK